MNWAVTCWALLTHQPVQSVYLILRSKKWSHHLIEEHIQEQAVDHAEDMLQKKQQPLLLWDESVQEKPESIEAEGLCAVRSSKAGRLLRIKRGYYDPPTKKPVHVPSLRWVALLLCGLHHPPVVAKFSWWTSRGKYVTSLSQLRFQLLQWVRDHFADAVLHVFDRGHRGADMLPVVGLVCCSVSQIASFCVGPPDIVYWTRKAD